LLYYLSQNYLLGKDAQNQLSDDKRQFNNWCTWVFVYVREITEFNGTSTKPVSKGHLPGAKHIEWKQVEDEHGNLLAAATLNKLFS
jgi:3-mercaptopyruvate sulfurtransferase SseA